MFPWQQYHEYLQQSGLFGQGQTNSQTRGPPPLYNSNARTNMATQTRGPPPLINAALRQPPPAHSNNSVRHPPPAHTSHPGQAFPHGLIRPEVPINVPQPNNQQRNRNNSGNSIRITNPFETDNITSVSRPTTHIPQHRNIGSLGTNQNIGQSHTQSGHSSSNIHSNEIPTEFSRIPNPPNIDQMRGMFDPRNIPTSAQNFGMPPMDPRMIHPALLQQRYGLQNIPNFSQFFPFSTLASGQRPRFPYPPGNYNEFNVPRPGLQMNQRPSSSSPVNNPTHTIPCTEEEASDRSIMGKWYKEPETIKKEKTDSPDNLPRIHRPAKQASSSTLESVVSKLVNKNIGHRSISPISSLASQFPTGMLRESITPESDINQHVNARNEASKLMTNNSGLEVWLVDKEAVNSVATPLINNMLQPSKDEEIETGKQQENDHDDGNTGICILNTYSLATDTSSDIGNENGKEKKKRGRKKKTSPQKVPPLKIKLPFGGSSKRKSFGSPKKKYVTPIKIMGLKNANKPLEIRKPKALVFDKDKPEEMSKEACEIDTKTSHNVETDQVEKTSPGAETIGNTGMNLISEPSLKKEKVETLPVNSDQSDNNIALKKENLVSASENKSTIPECVDDQEKISENSKGMEKSLSDVVEKVKKHRERRRSAVLLNSNGTEATKVQSQANVKDIDDKHKNTACEKTDSVNKNETLPKTSNDQINNTENNKDLVNKQKEVSSKEKKHQEFIEKNWSLIEAKLKLVEPHIKSKSPTKKTSPTKESSTESVKPSCNLKRKCDDMLDSLYNANKKVRNDGNSKKGENKQQLESNSKTEELEKKSGIHREKEQIKEKNNKTVMSSSTGSQTKICVEKDKAKGSSEKDINLQSPREKESKVQSSTEKDPAAKLSAEKDGKAKLSTEKDSKAKQSAEKDGKAKSSSEKDPKAKLSTEKDGKDTLTTEKDGKAKVSTEKDPNAKLTKKDPKFKLSSYKDFEAKLQSDKKSKLAIEKSPTSLDEKSENTKLPQKEPQRHAIDNSENSENSKNKKQKEKDNSNPQKHVEEEKENSVKKRKLSSKSDSNDSKPSARKRSKSSTSDKSLKKATGKNSEDGTATQECDSINTEMLDKQSERINDITQLISSISYPSFFVTFHGKRVLCLHSTYGKLLLMREILRRNFKDLVSTVTGKGGLPQQKQFRTVYLAKERDLKIGYKEIPEEHRKLAVKYLLAENLLKSDKMPAHLGVITVEDALRLYHYMNGLKACSESCIEIWSPSVEEPNQSHETVTNDKQKKIDKTPSEVSKKDENDGYESDVTIAYGDEGFVQDNLEPLAENMDNSPPSDHELDGGENKIVLRGGVAECYRSFFRYIVVEGEKFYPYEDLVVKFGKIALTNALQSRLPEKFRAYKCTEIEADFINKLEDSLPVLSIEATLLEEALFKQVASAQELLRSNTLVDLTGNEEDDDVQIIECQENKKGDKSDLQVEKGDKSSSRSLQTDTSDSENVRSKDNKSSSECQNSDKACCKTVEKAHLSDDSNVNNNAEVCEIDKDTVDLTEGDLEVGENSNEGKEEDSNIQDDSIMDISLDLGCDEEEDDIPDLVTDNKNVSPVAKIIKSSFDRKNSKEEKSDTFEFSKVKAPCDSTSDLGILGEMSWQLSQSVEENNNGSSNDTPSSNVSSAGGNVFAEQLSSMLSVLESRLGKKEDLSSEEEIAKISVMQKSIEEAMTGLAADLTRRADGQTEKDPLRIILAECMESFNSSRNQMVETFTKMWKQGVLYRAKFSALEKELKAFRSGTQKTLSKCEEYEEMLGKLNENLDEEK